MAAIHFDRMGDRLRDFQFQRLFIEELGWSQPAHRKTTAMLIEEGEFSVRHIAQLGGVVVVEVSGPDGRIPEARLRAAVHKELAKQFHENLLIFVDAARSQSLWYWVKRQ